MVLWPSLLINSTGLHALPLAKQLTLPPPHAPTSATGANNGPLSDPLALARAYVAGLPSARYCKGNYFKLQGTHHTHDFSPLPTPPCLPLI